MENAIDLVKGINMKWQHMTWETKVQIVLSMGVFPAPPMQDIDTIFTSIGLEIVLYMENGGLFLKMTDDSHDWVKKLVNSFEPLS